MRNPILSIVLLFSLLSTTGCTTTSGTDELLENDIGSIKVGMSKTQIKSVLGSPEDTYPGKTGTETQKIINNKFEDEVLNLPGGLYDVWYYEASRRTHHYFVVFHYNTYETNFCFFVFNKVDVSVYKRCRGVK